MRITLDTNVLLWAHGKARGSAQRLLDIIVREGHELVLSQAILYELEKVLDYPKIREATKLSGEETAAYLLSLERMARLVDLGVPMLLPIQDADDSMILRTALAGRVDVLCTRDRHLCHPLLDSLYQRCGIKVMSDEDLLRRLSFH